MKKSIQPPSQPNIDISKTTKLTTESGKDIWQQGFIVRKVSKFLTQAEDDAIMPLPVWYDPETGKILKGCLPPELQSEYDTL
jgi:hypothetical protein